MSSCLELKVEDWTGWSVWKDQLSKAYQPHSVNPSCKKANEKHYDPYMPIETSLPPQMVHLWAQIHWGWACQGHHLGISNRKDDLWTHSRPMTCSLSYKYWDSFDCLGPKQLHLAAYQGDIISFLWLRLYSKVPTLRWLIHRWLRDRQTVIQF